MNISLAKYNDDSTTEKLNFSRYSLKVMIHQPLKTTGHDITRINFKSLMSVVRSCCFTTVALLFNEVYTG